MQGKSHLYILVFPKRDMIKIGKANDIACRITNLQRFWGPVDYAASYFLKLGVKQVITLERALHNLLASHKLDFEQGSGKEEMFRAQALEIALEHLDIFCRREAIDPVCKGIAKPILPIKTNRTTERMHWKTKMAEQCTILQATAMKFERLQRLMLILKHWQHRIPFQYDIEDNQLYFRMVGKGRLDNRVFTFLKENLNAVFLDLTKTRDTPSALRLYVSGQVECSSEGGVVQYKINLPHLTTDHVRGRGVVECLYEQAFHVLNLLPRRSAALEGELPILDDTDTTDDLLGLDSRAFYAQHLRPAASVEQRM